MPGLSAIQAKQFAVAAGCDSDYRFRWELLPHDFPNSAHHSLKRIIILPKRLAGIVSLSVLTIRLSKIPLCLVSGERSMFHHRNVARRIGTVLPIFCDYPVMGIDRKILCDAEVEVVVLYRHQGGIEPMDKIKNALLIKHDRRAPNITTPAKQLQIMLAPDTGLPR